MKAVAEKTRKYYKNVIVESEFVRPNITSNGTLGGNSFAVTSGAFPWTGNSGAYQMFDGNTSTSAHSTNHNGGDYVEWYNPNPLKVTNVVCSAGYSGDWFNVTFKGSNDGTNWTDVAYFAHGVRQNCPVNSPDFYKYWMMYNNSGFSHDGHGYGGGIGEVYITGIEKVEGIEESTEADYDFYKDIYEYSLPHKVERKYYKYDTANPIYNVDTVGTITNNNGILSGFSANNYATLPSTFNPNNNTWEICLKTKLTSTTSGKTLFTGGQQGGGLYSIIMYTNNNQMQLFLSSNGSSFNIWNGAKVFDIVVNTDYWVKIEFDGNTYTAKYSTDGENYTTSATLNSSAVIYPNSKTYLGSNQGLTNYTFDGEIDLNESYIKINNEKWWDGVIYPAIEGTSEDYDFYEDIKTYFAIKSYEKGQYYGN